jgi:hypothetical protein
MGAQIVNVGLLLLDEHDGIFIELIKIVRCIIQPIAPIEPEPSDVLHDGIYIFNILLARISVIESQIAEAFIFSGESKVEADGLGMSDMEVTIRLRGEPCMDAAFVFVVLHVFGHDIVDKIRGRGRVDQGHPCYPFPVCFFSILMIGFCLFKAFSFCVLFCDYYPSGPSVFGVLKRKREIVYIGDEILSSILSPP